MTAEAACNSKPAAPVRRRPALHGPEPADPANLLNARSRHPVQLDVRDRWKKGGPVPAVGRRPLCRRGGWPSRGSSVTATPPPTTTRIRSGSSSMPPRWRTDAEDRGVHGEANYIRNSVSAVVDAYDGTTTLYAFDESDSAAAGLAQGVPRPARAPHGNVPRAAGASSLPGGPVLDPDRPVRLLPHRRRPRLLLQAGLLGPARGPLGADSPTARARSW